MLTSTGALSSHPASYSSRSREHSPALAAVGDSPKFQHQHSSVALTGSTDPSASYHRDAVHRPARYSPSTTFASAGFAQQASPRMNGDLADSQHRQRLHVDAATTSAKGAAHYSAAGPTPMLSPDGSVKDMSNSQSGLGKAASASTSASMAPALSDAYRSDARPYASANVPSLHSSASSSTLHPTEQIQQQPRRAHAAHQARGHTFPTPPPSETQSQAPSMSGGSPDYGGTADQRFGSGWNGDAERQDRRAGHPSEDGYGSQPSKTRRASPGGSRILDQINERPDSSPERQRERPSQREHGDTSRGGVGVKGHADGPYSAPGSSSSSQMYASPSATSNLSDGMFRPSPSQRYGQSSRDGGGVVQYGQDGLGEAGRSQGNHASSSQGTSRSPHVQSQASQQSQLFDAHSQAAHASQNTQPSTQRSFDRPSQSQVGAEDKRPKGPGRTASFADAAVPSGKSPKAVAAPVPHMDLATYPSTDLLRILAMLLQQIATANDDMRPQGGKGGHGHDRESGHGQDPQSGAHARMQRTDSGTSIPRSGTRSRSGSMRAGQEGLHGGDASRLGVTTAAQAALMTPSSTLCFHARNVPTITIESYLLRILKYCPTTNEVFLSLLVYFDRMSRMGSGSGPGEDNMATAAGQAAGLPPSRISASFGDLSHEGQVSAGSSQTELESGGQQQREPRPGMRGFAIDSFNVHRLIIAGLTVASKFFSDVFYTNSRYAKVGGLPVHELNQLELQFLLLNDFHLVIPLEELQRYADQLLIYGKGHQQSRSVPRALAGSSSSASATAHDRQRSGTPQARERQEQGGRAAATSHAPTPTPSSSQAGVPRHGSPMHTEED